jgi:hypothetical protein
MARLPLQKCVKESPVTAAKGRAERYTRAAEQERLARAAIKRQTATKIGKLLDEVANSEVEIEITA